MSNVRCHTLVALALAVSAAMWSTAFAQPTPTSPTIMVLFDGSGSMWGRLEGEKVAKFVTAREALKPALAKLDPRLPVGLTTFGSRRQADCTDATVAVPPEPGTEKLLALLDKYNPKGKSPLTLALREALKGLPTAGPRSLIIVHDDLDNCSLDPCSLAAELPPAGSGLTIHTVGLALRPEDAQRLQCLTAPTGGRVFDVQAATNVSASLEDAVRLASLMPSVPAPAAATKPAEPTTQPSSPQPRTATRNEPASRPALRTDGRPGIRLATVLGSGQPPRTLNPVFTIRRTDASATQAPVYTGRGQDLQVPLAPGAYVVEARDGLVAPPPFAFTVPERGQIAVDVPLAAGLLVTPATPPSSQAGTEAIVGLFERTSDGAVGAPIALVAGTEAETGLAIPPGRYILRLGDGNLASDQPVDMVAGAIVTTPSIWPFGRLQLTIAGATNRADAPVLVVVYEDDPDASRGRREITRSATTNPDLALPAGTYTIAARQGAVEARERLVIQGGQLVRRTLSLAGARLSLSSRLTGLPASAAASLSDDPITYRVERLDVVPAQVFTANRAQAEFDLPAGRYRIEARHGLVNARLTREIALGAGETSAVSLDHLAGSIQFTGPPRAGELLWELLDEAGDPLWSSAKASPRVTLKAGRYVVRLETRDRRIERRFEIRTGEFRMLEVTD